MKIVDEKKLKKLKEEVSKVKYGLGYRDAMDAVLAMSKPLPSVEELVKTIETYKLQRGLKAINGQNEYVGESSKDLARAILSLLKGEK